MLVFRVLSLKILNLCWNGSEDVIYVDDSWLGVLFLSAATDWLLLYFYSSIALIELACLSYLCDVFDLKVKCGRCGEVSQKETCVTLNETIPLQAGKGTTNLVQKVILF